MKVIVDQSGKVEQTEYDTVVAAVRGQVSSVIIIDRRVKRSILSWRIRISRKRKVLRTFSSAVLLAIKPILMEDDVIAIDNEYSGQMNYIKNWISRLIRKERIALPEDIITVSGEEISSADIIARRPLSANYILRIDERNKDILLRLII
jgi:ABC-type microcin C transport system permease subunit YejE